MGEIVAFRRFNERDEPTDDVQAFEVCVQVDDKGQETRSLRPVDAAGQQFVTLTCGKWGNYWRYKHGHHNDKGGTNHAHS